MNCGIIVIVMGIILSTIGNIFEPAQKHVIGKKGIIGQGLLVVQLPTLCTCYAVLSLLILPSV